jgi:hypothetical protein
MQNIVPGEGDRDSSRDKQNSQNPLFNSHKENHTSGDCSLKQKEIYWWNF